MYNSKIFIVLMSGLLVVVGGVANARAQDAATAGAPVAEPEEKLDAAALRDLVGPIALYPDPLIAQILPASTYPLEVVQAARYVQDHPGTLDEETMKGLDYDVSILAVMHYPDVLEMLNKKLDWTTSLGDAVANQQEDVMDAIQRFRELAYDAGNLTTNDQMTVAQQTVENTTVIQIEPANPQVVYVPTYNPQVVVVKKEESRADPVITFAAGLAVGAWLGYACNWGSSNIKIDVNHRGYWGRIRPGWGAGGGVWRPNAGRRAAYRHGARAGARAGYRAGRRSGARTGAVAGRRSGARAGAAAGRRSGAATGAAAGRRSGAAAGRRSGAATGRRSGATTGRRSGGTAARGGNRGAYGGYKSGRSANRHSNRGSRSRGGGHRGGRGGGRGGGRR